MVQCTYMQIHEGGSEMSKGLSRRRLLQSMAWGAGGALLAACQPKIVEVERIVTQEVEKVVKETVVVKEAVEVEKEVTRVVEKEADSAVPTPFPPTTLRFGFRVGQQPQVDVTLASFQTKYPQIEVELEPSPNAEAFRKFQVQAAGGTLPEALWIGNIVTWSFAEDGIVIDMMPMAELDPDVPLDDIYDPLVKMCQYQGQGWYMVPWAADAPVTYYNKTLFENAGLPVPSPQGLTVEEFIESAVAITDESQQIYGTNLNVKWNAIHLAWFSGFGGQFWNEDKSKVLINSPECVAAAQTLADLYHKHKCIVPFGADLGGDPFLLGRSGLVGTNRSFSRNLRDIKVDFEWDVCLPPKGPVRHSAITGTMGPAVSAGAKGGKEQIAYELVKSVLTPAVQRHFGRLYMIVPILKSMAKDASWYELPPPPANRDVFLDVLDIAETLPLADHTYCGTPLWGFTFDTIDQAWDEMIVGAVPAQEALDKAANLINDCIARQGR
jgi:multiple sugar transport system substrate-binding protein